MNIEKELLGKKVKLHMVKESEFGVYLSHGDYPELEVLLPNNQVPEGIRKGDMLEVFLYKDSEDRLIATRETPYITLHGTAPLRVVDVTNIGAFLDWGLAKDLLLPFKEQIGRVKVGDTVLAALYIDKSGRLCATMHVYDYLSCESPYRKNDHVRGRVYEITDSFGAFVAVDDKYSALLPHNELSMEFKTGQEITARVKEVTGDGKLTLSLQEKVKFQMGLDAQMLLKRLEDAGGFLPFHDKTSPEIIKREFKISKNAFKRAVGRLLKEKKIELAENGIKLKMPGQ